MTYELPRRILAIDPGLKTGVALFDLFSGSMTAFEVGDTLGGVLEEMIGRWRPAVVAEKFTITSATVRNSAAPWSLEWIGVARYLARKFECSFTLQLPANAKRFGTDARLKRLGWWIPGMGHAADAQRHTLLFLVNNGWWDDALTV